MSKPMIIGLGVAFLCLAVILFRRASRYDLTGLVVDAAWQAAKARGRPATPTELEQRVVAIRDAGSTSEQARMVAGAVGGHFVGKLLQILAWIFAAVGLGLAVFGIYWR